MTKHFFCNECGRATFDTPPKCSICTGKKCNICTTTFYGPGTICWDCSPTNFRDIQFEGFGDAKGPRTCKHGLTIIHDAECEEHEEIVFFDIDTIPEVLQ